MLNVMNLKKRMTRLFKWSRLATSFAFTFCLLAHPGSYFWIAYVRLSAGLNLLRFLNPLRLLFYWLSFKLCSSLLQRCVVGCRGEVFWSQRSRSIECSANALRNISAYVSGGFVALNAVTPEFNQYCRDVLHPELNGALCPTG